MGGGTKSFLAMLRGLMARGVQPVIAMPDREGVYSVIKEMGIPTIIVPYFDSVYPWVRSLKDVVLFLPRIIRHRVMNYLAIRKITQALRQEGIQLIHSNVSVCSIGFWVSRRLNVPHIYHIREYGDKDFSLYHFPSRRWYYRQLRTSESYNICITRDIQRHFKQSESVASRVIYNGIQDAVEVYPQHERSDFFLFAGRLIETKGIFDLLRAYSDYFKEASNKLPLYVMGEQPNHDYYEQLVHYVKEHGLEDVVKFMGERSDISNFMSRARAIIIPSHNEGFGRCMPEAMFCGCLAIGRNTGGTREQMDNGVTLTGEEIALRYDTQEQLKQYLLMVSNNNDSYFEPYRQRAFETVNQLYSTESNVRQVYDFYQNILKKEGESI